MRYDLISPRPRKDGKTFWHKVGAAFARDSGGFSLVLNSLPLPDSEGKLTVLMVEAKPRQEPQEGMYSDRGNTAPEIEDSIPF